MAKPLSQRPLDILFVVFLASHIPITLFVDSQAVLPRSWFPQAVADVSDWYLDTYKDPLMTHRPLWFKALCWTELLLQLPFFLLGTYAFAAGRNWVRTPALCYGSFVTATMVPILAELALAKGEGVQSAALFGFYLPYLVVPLAMVARMAASEKPFGEDGKGGKRE